MARYWGILWRRTWEDMGGMIGGLPKTFRLWLALLLGSLVPWAWTRPTDPNIPLLAMDIVTIGSFVVPTILVAVFLFCLVSAPAKIHVEQTSAIDELRKAATPVLRIRHVATCSQCNGSASQGNPSFHVEVSQTSTTESVTQAQLDITEISPSPFPWPFPIVLGRWQALNAGESPTHARIFRWDVDESGDFVFGPVGALMRWPPRAYTVRLVAHAFNTPAATEVCEIEPVPTTSGRLLWRVRQVEKTASPSPQ